MIWYRYIFRATCTTTGGDPPPRLSWYREHVLIDDTYETSSQPSGDGTSVTTTVNDLDYATSPVKEGDLGTVFTCQAVNNNQTIPLATNLKLDITCECE